LVSISAVTKHNENDNIGIWYLEPPNITDTADAIADDRTPRIGEIPQKKDKEIDIGQSMRKILIADRISSDIISNEAFFHDSLSKGEFLSIPFNPLTIRFDRLIFNTYWLLLIKV
jgi:hypothetical protein